MYQKDKGLLLRSLTDKGTIPGVGQKHAQKTDSTVASKPLLLKTKVWANGHWVLSNSIDKRSESQQKRTWAWGSTTFIRSWSSILASYVTSKELRLRWTGGKSPLFSPGHCLQVHPPLSSTKWKSKASFLIRICNKESNTRSSYFLTTSYYKHTICSTKLCIVPLTLFYPSL